MLRKVLLLAFALIVGTLVASLLGVVAGTLLSLIPEDWDRAAEYASLSVSLPLEGARFAAVGFIYWSGSRASVKEAAVWAALGATALEPLFAAVFGWGLASLALAHPLFFVATLLARAAGGYFGAKLGDDYETDRRVHLLQETLFRLYPFALPR